MEIKINTDKKTLELMTEKGVEKLSLYSDESFKYLSDLWSKVGWNQKYTYTFSWLGRPIIQLPEDMVRIQELFWNIKPDIVIETGVAHGGSLIFYASLFNVLKKGMVIGVDIEIRKQNRIAIESHPLFDYIKLVEGNSIDSNIVHKISELIPKEAKVLVILDSCHTKDHVLAEMESYGPLITKGSYLVVTDGVMKNVSDTPRGNPDWIENNPLTAIDIFLKDHHEFELETQFFPFNESTIQFQITHWPNAYLKKLY